MASQKSPEPFTKIPEHIAIIMDGNGRWANQRGLPRLAGHSAGTKNVKTILRACVEFGVKYLTLYAFSTENWTRPEDEVGGLMKLLHDSIENEFNEIHREGVRVLHIGNLEGLEKGLQSKIRNVVEQTKDNTRITFILAINYGGRDEMLHAIKQMMQAGVSPDALTPELVSRHLYTAGVPDPDLVIRTSGEQRTSNFLLWQSVYSEWYFPPMLWPDFNKEALREAILEFGRRKRRFGGLNSE